MTFAGALAAMISTLGAANLERTGVTYEIQVGDEYLDANSAPPRIVIVPLGAQPAGARSQVPGATRSIAGETHLFAAQLWAKAQTGETAKGKDYVAVSTMKATFTAAMRAAFGTNFQLGTGQWTAVEGESIEEDGRQYLQQFTLSQVSLDIPAGYTNVTVTHTTTNTGITDPGDEYLDPPS